MFYSLTGTVVFTDENSVALDCGGVAFRLFTTLNTLKKWAPNMPHLYQIQIALEYNGAVSDQYKTQFGVRSFVQDT